MAAAGLALVIGPLALALPADAEQRSGERDRRAAADVVTDKRHDGDLEVLSMACRVVDHATDQASDRPSDRPAEPVRDKATDAVVAPAPAPAPGPTRIHIGCRWRPSQHQATAGYQLWRIVDRGEREMVARGGLDMEGARDVVSAKARVVRYAVLAVNKDGRRVGQSRVVEIRLHDDGPRDHPRRRAINRVR